MKKLLLLSVFVLLFTSCVSRDNPYDPSGDDYNPLLNYPENTILISPKEINTENATITIEVVNFTADIAALHIVFVDQNIVIDTVEIITEVTGVETLPNSKAIEIASMETPIKGTMKIATVKISGVTNSGKLDIALGNDSTSVKDVNDIEIPNIVWIVPEIN